MVVAGLYRAFPDGHRLLAEHVRARSLACIHHGGLRVPAATYSGAFELGRVQRAADRRDGGLSRASVRGHLAGGAEAAG